MFEGYITSKQSEASAWPSPQAAKRARGDLALPAPPYREHFKPVSIGTNRYALAYFAQGLKRGYLKG